jgi:transposase
VYGIISWDFKGTLHFYEGTGKQGRLIQSDYVKILEDVVAPEWDENLILVENNDGPHGTKGESDNKVKQVKIKLNIKWEAQPSNSPDLNPIKTIWRIIKQRLKNRGVIFTVEELKQAIQVEWEVIIIKEINKAISTMPGRVTCLRERFGKAIPY